jgi:hypothetical protein
MQHFTAPQPMEAPMPVEVEAIDPHRPFTVPAALLVLAALGAAVLLMSSWAWLAVAGVLVLGVAVGFAEARRGALPDLPRVRHVAGE